MAGETFQLEVATPERELVNEQVTQAEIPAFNGYIGILARHAPLISKLGAGVLTYEGGGGPHVLAISGGFVEVSDNHVRVLADLAEAAEEIRVEQARKQLDEANQQLSKANDEQSSAAAIRASQTAQARIDAAQHGSGAGQH